MNHFYSVLAERRLGSLWKQELDLASFEKARAVADRAVISGTWFFTTLLIARYSDASQLGIYAVGISVLAVLVAFQDSLIFKPYTIERHWPQGAPLGSLLILSLLLSAGSTLTLIIGALGVLKRYGSSEMALMTFALAGALPFVLTREFARQTALTRIAPVRATLLELAAATIQLSALVWLGLNGRMSAVSACAALGGASAITVAGWLYCARAEFSVRKRQVRTIFEQTWAVGKWLLVGQIAVQAQRHIIYWVAMLVAGAAVTGVYAACMSIVSFLSPLIFALGNVLTPRLRFAWKNDGGPGLWHETVRNTVLIASLILPLCLAVLLLGETVMRFLFPGTEYEGHRYTLTILALVMFSEAFGMPAAIALGILKRPRAIVMTGTVGAVLTLVLVWPLMEQLGLLGAAFGSLAGAATASIGRWVMFHLRAPKGCDPILVMRTVQDVVGSANSNHWKITRLGGGQYAETFLVQSNGSPLIGCHHSLVVKIYKRLKDVTFQMVQAEFDSLSKLHTTLHGREINGWEVSIPCPLFIHKSPVALVMTEVPGRHIDSYASRNDILTSRNLRDAARAFATTMPQCWSSGGRHGDLGVHNVLFDIEAKKISFVDAGTSAGCPVCNSSTKPQSSQASDLAHVLYDVSIDAMDMIHSLTMRMHREAFVENVLHTIIENIESPKEKRLLLDDIWSSAQQHMSLCLEHSWSPKGMWHGFLKRILTQRISSIVERVASQTNVYCMGDKS
jgi:O-antigen/teichoic acid export membrane protein/tRNA A-37 threonylcarbamoyl transferase component Bud32